MPQTNVLADWKANYPRDALCQKPGGVTPGTTLIATAVPNKPQWTGTQLATAEEQARVAEEEESHGEETQEEETSEESEEETEEEDEEGGPRPRRGRRGRR